MQNAVLTSTFISTYFDSHDGDARALIPEGEVHSFFGNFHGFCLGIDHHFIISVEPSFSRSNTTWKHEMILR